MKFSKPLDAILNTEAKTRILRFLCRTNADWNGNQIAREIGISAPAAHTALNSLYKEGVLQLRTMGNTHVYSLKQDTFLVSSLLKPLFAREDKLLDAVIDIVKRKIASFKARSQILSVALFGSTSISRESPTSDIDIAVIVQGAKAKHSVERLFDQVDAKISKEFGNTVSPYINTLFQFKAKRKQGMVVVKNILKSYRLLYGKRLESLL